MTSLTTIGSGVKIATSAATNTARTTQIGFASKKISRPGYNDVVPTASSTTA